MLKKRFVLSLKWRLTLVFSSIILFFLSISSGSLYVDASENFESEQQKITLNHIHTAQHLINASFKDLAQTIHLFLINHHSNSVNETINMISQNIDAWSSFIQVDNALFFNTQGHLIKRWLPLRITPYKDSVLSALKSKKLTFQINCKTICYQQAIIPVFINGKLIGALSMARSLDKMMTDYHAMTDSIGGILLSTSTLEKFSIVINTDLTQPIFKQLKEKFSLSELLAKRRTIYLNHQPYQLKIFPLKKSLSHQPVFFMILRNIHHDLNILNFNLNKIILFGGVNFLIAFLLLLIVIRVFLIRLSLLSETLPLLANQHYDEFKQKIASQSKIFLAHDDVNQLNETALIVTQQLETLETQVQKNTQQLLEKSEELAIERDFIQQLIEIAPIIIILQDLDGHIVSINKTGVNALEIQRKNIIGQKFTRFIPTTETEHLNKIESLKHGKLQDIFKIDGLLLTNKSNYHVSWLHSLIKGKNSGLLVLSLGINISSRKRIEAEMIKMSTIDTLTGLKNKKIFQSDLENKINSAQRYGFPLALLYLDLDQFKRINDASNHATGDKLLLKFTQELKKSLRSTDLLFRIGGDEFAIVMPIRHLNGVEIAAAKINRDLSQLEYPFNHKIYRISVSIGIAIYPHHGKNIDDLMTHADLAMYRAKEQGGAQYHVFSPTINYHTLLTQNHYWRESIEDALIHNRFVLLFQPILELNSHVVTHYECLVRMLNEKEELIIPEEFMEIAAKIGIVDKIDRWVIKAAIKKQIALKQVGKDYHFSINLSASAFNNLTTLETIVEQLKQPHVNPQKIIFEITESSAVSNFLAAQSLIEQLKNIGCMVALDDFGIGFSSFYYLKHLSVDYVKLDGSIIRQIDKNHEDKVLIKALIDISQVLGKKVVAEFVENEAILNILKGFNIEYAQGYLIGKPQLLELTHNEKN